MPKKVRQLKGMLRKAGFTWRPGKGSHTVWEHPKLRGRNVVLSGNDGDDAEAYQEKQVRRAIKEVQANP
jgi:predicted RNA binding protein YcfA (HicA-like mRNA interferase family)